MERVSRYYDTIYLSPHLDDAVLSCGGQIWQATADQQSVLIITIMAGDAPVTAVSTFAQQQHQNWNLLSEAVAQRRAEDVVACSLVGADYWHWQIPDCIYRTHPQTGAALYNTNADIFGAVHPAEYGLIEALAVQLAALPAYGRIFAPLTVGNHVDHQLTRLAAERCLGNGLHYYEDYPYVQRLGGVGTVLGPDDGLWQMGVVPLTTAVLQRKIEAIAAYGSQVGGLFNGRMAQDVAAHTAAVGGERIYWKVAELA